MRGLAVIAAGCSVWILRARRTRHFASMSIRAAGRRLRPPAWSAAGVAAAVFGTTLGIGLSGVATIGLMVGALSAAAPYLVALTRAERERRAVAAAWPDFLGLLRGHLSGGTHLAGAFVAAAASCPGTLASVLQRPATRIRAGADFTVVLRELRTELADGVADQVLLTLLHAHRSGGGKVSRLLAAVAASIADELRLRDAHYAAMTQQRLTAAVALVAPWVLLMLTAATNPQAGTAYATATGRDVIVFGGLVTIVGFVLARRSARLDSPTRVFA